MTYIQNIVRTQNEKNVSYIMLALGAAVFLLFVVYISLMYQVTHVAYAISNQEKEASVYLDRVALLESSYHTKKRSIMQKDAYEAGFAKITKADYVSVNTETYSLAR